MASERTTYRLLAAEHGAVRERRAQLLHPPYAAPELLAERPNEVYSRDITKLKGDDLKARRVPLADLSVLKTHSRPYTSTDNPYSRRVSRH